MATVLNIAKPFKWFSISRFRSKPKSPNPSPSILAPKHSKKEDEYRQVFCFFDSNGDGKISIDELRGESVTREEAQRVITEFDSDGDGLLEFEDLVRLMEREKEEDDDDLRRAFKMFEVEKGCGCITPNGLQQVLSRLEDSKLDEECEAMIRVFDVDGNGVIDFHEFHKMITCTLYTHVFAPRCWGG